MRSIFKTGNPAYFLTSFAQQSLQKRNQLEALLTSEYVIASYLSDGAEPDLQRTSVALISSPWINFEQLWQEASSDARPFQGHNMTVAEIVAKVSG